MPTAGPSARPQCCTRAPEDRNLREGWLIGQTSASPGRELDELLDRLFSHWICRGRRACGDRARRMGALTAAGVLLSPSVEQLFEQRVTGHRNLEERRRLAGAARARRRSNRGRNATLDGCTPRVRTVVVNHRRRKSPSWSDCVCGTTSRTTTMSLPPTGVSPTSDHFGGAGAFLDEYLRRDQEGWSDGDYMLFYRRTIWISRRADLMPVYAMIFRRLKAAVADWVTTSRKSGSSSCHLGTTRANRAIGIRFRKRQSPSSKHRNVAPRSSGYEGTARNECACARARNGPPTTCGPRLPANVRRDPRWPPGMKTGAHYVVRSRMFEISPAPERAHLELPPIRRSDPRLSGSDGARQGYPPQSALRGLDPRHALPQVGHLSERRPSCPGTH